MTTIEKIKMSLRTSHNKLDEDIQADIDFVLADLRMHGVIHADESDPLIFNAVKLGCKSLYVDDPAKAEAYRDRYIAMRDYLKVAEGYGWRDDSDE